MAETLKTHLAMIADPHFRNAEFRPAGWPASMPFLRSFRDSISSLRVLNETEAALRAALDEVVKRNIKIVVMPGDLTEDGQHSDLDRFVEITSEYRQLHGLMFFATFGNHDAFGMSGKHYSKPYIGSDGKSVLATSCGDADIVDPALFTSRYDTMMEILGDFGFMRQPGYIHWETPFGTSDSLQSRVYTVLSDDNRNVSHALDASYLVEPVEDLWLLVLDSNVYQPKDGDQDLSGSGAFIDSKVGKWKSVIRHRNYLLAWMADVSARARAMGKTLITCSHYAMMPIDDPNPEEDENRVAPETISRLIETGIGVHFSGHSHVCNVAWRHSGSGTLLDVALPATCSFPPAFRTLTVSNGEISVETISLGEVADFGNHFNSYLKEVENDLTLKPALRELSVQRNFGRFMSAQLGVAVNGTLMDKHFGAQFGSLARSHNLASALQILGSNVPFEAENLLIVDVVSDWYRLSRAGRIALDFIPASRIATYKKMAATLPDTNGSADRAWQQLRKLLIQLSGMAADPYSESIRISTDGSILEPVSTSTLQDISR